MGFRAEDKTNRLSRETYDRSASAVIPLLGGSHVALYWACHTRFTLCALYAYNGISPPYRDLTRSLIIQAPEWIMFVRPNVHGEPLTGPLESSWRAKLRSRTGELRDKTRSDTGS